MYTLFNMENNGKNYQFMRIHVSICIVYIVEREDLPESMQILVMVLMLWQL